MSVRTVLRPESVGVHDLQVFLQSQAVLLAYLVHLEVFEGDLAIVGRPQELPVVVGHVHLGHQGPAADWQV